MYGAVCRGRRFFLPPLLSDSRSFVEHVRKLTQPNEMAACQQHAHTLWRLSHQMEQGRLLVTFDAFKLDEAVELVTAFGKARAVNTSFFHKLLSRDHGSVLTASQLFRLIKACGVMHIRVSGKLLAHLPRTVAAQACGQYKNSHWVILAYLSKLADPLPRWLLEEAVLKEVRSEHNGEPQATDGAACGPPAQPQPDARGGNRRIAPGKGWSAGYRRRVLPYAALSSLSLTSRERGAALQRAGVDAEHCLLDIHGLPLLAAWCRIVHLGAPEEAVDPLIGAAWADVQRGRLARIWRGGGAAPQEAGGEGRGGGASRPNPPGPGPEPSAAEQLLIFCWCLDSVGRPAHAPLLVHAIELLLQDDRSRLSLKDVSLLLVTAANLGVGATTTSAAAYLPPNWIAEISGGDTWRECLSALARVALDRAQSDMDPIAAIQCAWALTRLNWTEASDMIELLSYPTFRFHKLKPVDIARAVWVLHSVPASDEAHRKARLVAIRIFNLKPLSYLQDLARLSRGFTPEWATLFCIVMRRYECEDAILLNRLRPLLSAKRPPEPPRCWSSWEPGRYKVMW
ncbi:hypothetical protein DIPPA_05868 [Diplonema papillatum]|nr:hypothetical protein DIPPA_05868 [Diplonema papillatum]